jgi:hypothetical protein
LEGWILNKTEISTLYRVAANIAVINATAAELLRVQLESWEAENLAGVKGTPEAIRKEVQSFCGKDNNRPIIQKVAAVNGCLVALDGFRLAVAHCPDAEKYADDLSQEQDPKWFINMWNHVLLPSKENANLQTAFNSAELIALVRQAQAQGMELDGEKPKDTLVMLQIQPDSIKVSYRGNGTVTETGMLQAEGTGFAVVNIRASYLLDHLRFIAEKRQTLHMLAPKEGYVINSLWSENGPDHTKPGYRAALVLPVRPY